MRLAPCALGSLVLVATLQASAPSVASGPPGGTSPPTPAAAVAAARAGGRVLYEPNRGQAPGGVAAIARGGRTTLFLDVRGFSLALRAPTRSDPDGGPRVAVEGFHNRVLRVDVEGAREGAAVAPVDPTGGVSHYFHGRAAPVRGVPHFTGARVDRVLEGVDLAWTSEGTLPRFDFALDAGVPAAAVALRIRGADAVRVVADGALAAETPLGTVRFSPPRAFAGAARRPVPCRWEAREDGAFGFAASGRADGEALVIDPTIDFITRFGGAGAEDSLEVAVGPGGTVVLAGMTTSPDLPVENAVQTALLGSRDAFVARLSAAGDQVLSSTYIGGSADDFGEGVDVAADGSIWIGGYTASTDFPLASPYQSTRPGATGAFACRLSADGSELEFSTYFGGTTASGGNAGTLAYGVAADPSGGAWLTGLTFSTDLPLASAFQSAPAGSNDGFIARFSGEGGLLFSSYLGGPGYDRFATVKVNGMSAVCAGYSSSASLSLDSGTQTSPSPDGALIAWVRRSDHVLQSAFGFASAAGAEAFALAVAEDGTVCVGGSVVYTQGFPYVGGSAGGGGNNRPFLARFNPLGNVDLAITLNDVGTTRALAFGHAGSLFAGGSVSVQAQNPVAPPVEFTKGAGTDAFLMRRLADGKLDWLALHGGISAEATTSLAFRDHVLAFAGWTTSQGFPVLNALYPSALGSTDMFAGVIHYLPNAPKGLEVTKVFGTSVFLEWDEVPGGDVTGYEVSRRPLGGEYAPGGSTGPTLTSTSAGGLVPLTTYEFRVRAMSDLGPPDWSPAVEGTTTDIPPPPPTAVTAQALSADAATVSWADASGKATAFQVLRRDPEATSLAPVASLGAATTSITVGGLLPARRYGFVVRASSSLGESANSAEATAWTDATAEWVLLSGKAKDSPTTRKDKVVLTGRLDGAPDLDPVSDGLDLTLDSPAGTWLRIQAGGASAWSVTRRAATWKAISANGARVTMKWNGTAGLLVVKASGLNFPVPPATEVHARLLTAADGAAAEETWTEKKPGNLSFKAPKVK